MHSSPAVDEMDLFARIVEAAVSLQENNDVFFSVCQSIQARFTRCFELRGCQFEHTVRLI